MPKQNSRSAVASSKRKSPRNTGPRKRKASSSRSSSRTSTPRPRTSTSRAKRARNSSSSQSRNGGSDDVCIVRRISPRKSPNDPNSYRILKLSNGLTVALISRKSPKGSNASSKRGQEDRNNAKLGNIRIYNHCDCNNGDTNNPRNIGDDIERSSFPFPAGGGVPAVPTPSPPHTSICAVINVGSSDDPEECQGASHFLEHVVHFGSRKFPNEDAHLEIHFNFGTLWNACTRPHSTTYHHEIPDFLLGRSFDCFADMLAFPSMKQDLLRREVNAVDNEFDLRQCDSLRCIMLFQHVFIQNQNHPVARFSCGNIETLGGGGSGDNGSPSVQEFLREHHAKYYVASAMTLCINSTKSLNELEELSLHHFSDLLQGDRETFLKDDSCRGCEQLIWKNQGKLVVLQGINSLSELVYWWHLPASLLISNTKEMVIPIISTIFSDSSAGSLLQCLKEKNLIWSMRPEYACSKYTTIFGLCFRLTSEGRSNIEQIEQATFAFLYNLIQTPEVEMSRLFREMQTATQANFNYGSQYASHGYTVSCATFLQSAAREEEMLTSDLVSANTCFNYKRIKNALSLLKTDNLFVIEVKPKDVDIESLRSLPQFRNAEVKRAPHTQAKYMLVPRDDERILKSCSLKDFTFQFIPRNKYLDGGKAPLNYGDIVPQRLPWKPSAANKVLGGVHHGHREASYNPFKGTVTIQFLTSLACTSPRSRCLCSLWAKCILHSISHEFQQLSLADYNVQITCEGDYMVIRVDGYPGHLKAIVDLCVNAMFHQRISPEVVDIAKENLKCAWEYTRDDRSTLVRSVLESVLYRKKEKYFECLTHLKTANLEELQCAIELFKRSSSAFVTLSGNVPTSMFQSIGDLLERQPFGPELEDPTLALPSYKSQHLPPVGARCIRLKSPASKNVCTTVRNCYIFIQRDAYERELFSTCMDFMSCQAFLFLRTKHQLGYSVNVGDLSSGYRGESSLLSTFVIEVTATARKFTPCELDRKIDEFLEFYGSYLDKLPKDLFEDMRKLKNIPNNVNQADVATWYKAKFGMKRAEARADWNFQLASQGIHKLSIQVVGVDEKKCPCQDCQSIKGWQPWNRSVDNDDDEEEEGSASNDKRQVLLAVGSGITKDFFMTAS